MKFIHVALVAVLLIANILIINDNAKDGKVKPVMVGRLDGGPDENIRYIKSIIIWTILFCKYKFDTLILVMTTPGWSAFNEVERIMSFFNDWLNGLIFDPFQFGKVAGDEDREKYNFEQCMVDLCNIINQNEIDHYPVKAMYRKPEPQRARDLRVLELLFETFETVEEFTKWSLVHTKASQYHLQFVSCLNKAGDCKTCETMPRSQYFEVNKRSNNAPFLPTLIAHQHIDGKLEACEPGKKLRADAHYASYVQCLNYDLQTLPMDVFNPQFNKKSIEKRICKQCNYYFNSIKKKEDHEKSEICMENKSNDYFSESLDVMQLFDHLIPSQKYENITKIITQRGDGIYLVKYIDGDREWLKLPLSMQCVVDYTLLQTAAPQATEEKMPVLGMHDVAEFCHFEELSDDSDIDLDIFNDNMDKICVVANSKRRVRRELINIRHQPRLPPIQYKEGDTYGDNTNNLPPPVDYGRVLALVPALKAPKKKKEKKSKKKKKETKKKKTKSKKKKTQTKSKKKKAIPKDCPEEHGLTQQIIPMLKEFYCDGCRKQMFLYMYGCRKCNFDLCEHCWMKANEFG